MRDNDVIEVTNRDSGWVGYQIPDTGIKRNFAPRETKKLPFSEIKALQYVPGGEYMLRNLLIINNRTALDVLNMQVEPEYFYTDDEIKYILTDGSLDQLRDFLDFSPEGGIEIIKKMAVELEVPDTRKRKIISEKTGFNIDNAIQVNRIMQEDDEKKEEAAEPAAKRRTAPVTASGEEAPVRRAEVIKPKIKVITPKENVEE